MNENNDPKPEVAATLSVDALGTPPTEGAPQSISLDSLSPELLRALQKALIRKQGVGPVARGRRTLPKDFEEKRKAKRKAARKARRITRLNAK